jgi:hypothetical protein
MPPPSNLASRPHTPPVRVVLAAQMIAPNGFLAVEVLAATVLRPAIPR